MESVKQKLGFLALILSLALIAAAIWYCLQQLPGRVPAVDGTLVQGILTSGKMVNV